MNVNPEKYPKRIEEQEYGWDPNYYALLQRIKPGVNYHEQSFGDKLLFFRRVDKLDYDVVIEKELKKRREHLEGMQKLKDQQDAGQNASQASVMSWTI